MTTEESSQSLDGKVHNDIRSGLEAYERDDASKPPFYLTAVEAKLLGIAGVGFFLDGEYTLRMILWRRSLKLASSSV